MKKHVFLFVFGFLLLFLISSCVQTPKAVEELSTDKNSEYYYNLGMAALSSQNYSKAIANFKMAILKYPYNYKAYDKLAIAYANVNDFKNALKNIDKALSIKPDYYEGLLDKASILELSGNTKEAIKTLNKCIDNDLCALKPEAYYNLALIYKNNPSKYIKNLNLAVLYDRNFEIAKYALAKAYVDYHQCSQKPIEYKVLMLLKDQNNEDANLLKAKCYIEAKDFKKARDIINTITLNQNTKPVYKKEALNLLKQIILEESLSNNLPKAPLVSFANEQNKPIKNPKNSPKENIKTKKHPNIIVKNPWVLLMPPNYHVSFAYMEIENIGNKEDELIGVDSSISSAAELHEVLHTKKGFKMVVVKSFKIKPKQTLYLKPNDKYIILIGLKHPLKVGEKITLWLHFKYAGNIKIIAVVRKR